MRETLTFFSKIHLSPRCTIPKALRRYYFYCLQDTKWIGRRLGANRIRRSWAFSSFFVLFGSSTWNVRCSADLSWLIFIMSQKRGSIKLQRSSLAQNHYNVCAVQTKFETDKPVWRYTFSSVYKYIVYYSMIRIVWTSTHMQCEMGMKWYAHLRTIKPDQLHVQRFEVSKVASSLYYMLFQHTHTEKYT